MNPIHRIHLRGFWNITTDPQSGQTIHQRRFGRPRTIDAHESVWIVLAFTPGNASVWLNQVELGSIGLDQAAAYDITEQILQRNELLIMTDAPPTELLGEVVMEIRHRE